MHIGLEIQGLHKYYGQYHALKNINLTLTDGVYGLLGPNGAGKSTLMNILTDNLLPSKGKVLFDGKDIQGLGKNYLKELGFMPQQQGLYDTFTAIRFLYYMAALKGINKKEADEQIPELLEMVNLAGDRHRRLDSFSGGMKQRILIAQALLGNPKILILDEPTAGLDPKERIRIRNLISEISFNKIVIIATHVVPDIEFIAKQVILLKKGELIDSGSPHQLVQKMAGLVYEIKADIESLPLLRKCYKVSNISKDEQYIYVRVVSDEPPGAFLYEEVKPTLEDLYLHVFDTEEAG